MTTWVKWRGEIAKAMGGSHQTLESLETDLIEGRARLWATEDACMVVEFATYPGGAVACQVMWAAGELDTLIAQLAELEADVKAAGCSEMLIEGRAGWARALRSAGYEPWSVTVRKEL